MKGFSECYGGYNSCYDLGFLDGITVNEDVRTGQFESKVGYYGGCYDEGFHLGCTTVQGTREGCFDMLYEPPQNLGNRD